MYEEIACVLDGVLGTNQKIDLLGFSLGGGVAMYMLYKRPSSIRRAVLLCPGSRETVPLDFQSKSAENPGIYHGWETLEGLQHFFKAGLGFYPEAIPFTFIQRGMVKLRSLEYPSGYLSGYIKAFHASKKFHTFLADNGRQMKEALEKSGTEVLIATGERDVVCEYKSMSKIENALGSKVVVANVVIPDCGHYGGPKGKSGPDANVLAEASAICTRFLDDDHSSTAIVHLGASPVTSPANNKCDDDGEDVEGRDENGWHIIGQQRTRRVSLSDRAMGSHNI
mmetsp:Transcript_32449/g.63424  ORF Transcript_32449/g.63424 Transcript_32449/m.63424 type:complete len:281 (+) Transcript_32449:1-843(+)